jgi:hypothetical protein
MPNLAARYRRLLWTYPRDWRRTHGPDLVTTLLDAAPPDRTRPTRAEALDLLWGGVRLRLRVRGAGAVTAAAVACLFVAVAGAALGGALGWATAPDLPDDAAAYRLVQPALPAGTPAAPRRWDFTFDDHPEYTDPAWSYWLLGTDVYESGQVFFDRPYPDGAEASARAEAARVRARLDAAGWRLSGAAAHRDGHRIEVAVTYGLGSATPLLRVSVMRDRPAAVLPLTAVGLLLGGLFGWLAVAAAWRRGRRQAESWRVLPTALFGAATLTAVPATAASAIAVVMSTRPDDVTPAWIGYAFIGARPLAWVSLLVLGAAWLMTFPRGRPVPVVARR